MYILVHGKSGLGKSNLGDVIKGIIFKMDPSCAIHVDDEDRKVKTFGGGDNEHTINVMRTLEEEDEKLADVVIRIRTGKFKEWYQEFGY